MSGRNISRRRALRAGAALGSTAFLGGIAGCQGSPLGNDNTTTTDSGESGPLAAVPAAATYVVRVDVDTILENERVESVANDVLAFSGTAPETLADLLDRAETETGLDPREVDDVVTFGAPEAEQFGAVLRTDWSEDDVATAAEDTAESLESTTHNGVPVYKRDSSGRADGVAALGDGVFAVGDVTTVETVVDVSQGDADPVDGTVRSAYEAAADGVVRLGFEMPSGETGGRGPEATVARNTASGHGSLTIGDDATVTLDLTAESESGAETVASTLESELTALEEQVQQGAGTTGRVRDLTERMVTVVENTTVTRDGRTVTVTSTSSVEAVGTVVGAIVSSFVLGLGSSQSTSPTAAFDTEYDRTAETLTITHEGGDAIPRSELSVRGTGFQSVSGVDMTRPGQWQGTTSGGTSGDPAVAAGDSVTVGVQSDHRISVVWRASTGDSSAVLADTTGPDA